MYYIKIIVNFQKTVTNLPYSLHLYVNIPQAGIDLSTYPANRTKNWIIAYGVFDIKPIEVATNVDLDMNWKKIFNIAPDKTRNNSAATVKMAKDLYPYTKNNLYREIFEEFDNLSDVGIYKIITGRPSRIIFMGLLPNISFYNINIATVSYTHLTLPTKRIV